MFNRVDSSLVVKNQLPSFLRDDFPLLGEFLTQYYISQNYQGGPANLLENIDQYLNLDNLSNLIESTTLSSDIRGVNKKIEVSSTNGFPDHYGLLQIDDEIITYTEKTSTSFLNCSRGFSGVKSYNNPNSPDQLLFSETDATNHSSGSKVINLSVLFLSEFFKKFKYQYNPGFSERSIDSSLNKKLVLSNLKNFYESKGSDESFEILFRVLYGKDVTIIKPKDFLLKSSDADYRKTIDLVVETIDGDVSKLIDKTIFQDKTSFQKEASGAVSGVQLISRDAKEYTVLNLDKSSIAGEFSIHPKTKLITPVVIGATFLDVDSTIGFPKSGELLVQFADGVDVVINYSDKTVNQFLQCTGVSRDIDPEHELLLNENAYGYLLPNNSGLVKFRINGVISDIDIKNETKLYQKKDSIFVKGLGYNDKTPRASNWVFNIANEYDVSSITLLNVTDQTYEVETFNDVTLTKGSKIKLTSSTGVVYDNVTITSISNRRKFTIKGAASVNTSSTIKYKVLSKINHANSVNYPDINQFSTDVQNVYVGIKSTFITSSSLPNYTNPLDIKDQSVTFSGSFSGDTLFIQNHGFITGDSVRYHAPSNSNSLGIDDLEYFVNVIDSNNLQLSFSAANIRLGKFISIDGTKNVTNNKLQLTRLFKKSLSSDKIVRRFSDVKNTKKKTITEPGEIGTLVNGVPVINYKSLDSINYGDIVNSLVIADGDDYDVINPPNVIITDSVGYGATVSVSVVGDLKRVDIIDPGFHYDEVPVIEFTGGNGSGAVADVSLTPYTYSASFKADSGAGVGVTIPNVDLSNNQVAFSTYHKFNDGEEVFYRTFNQSSVGGISTDSRYFLRVIDANRVSIHNNLSDVVSGTNSLSLNSFGIGNHAFESVLKKKRIGTITVKNSGSGYENREVRCGVSGINTSLNYINIKNHGFSSGETITYKTVSGSTAISGLTENSDYILTKVDNDNFSLSSVGVGTTAADFFFASKQNVNIVSVGVGTHIFKYPDIKATLLGKVGVTTFAPQDLRASIKPIFRGSLKSSFLNASGVGYGSSTIINFIKKPNIDIRSGTGAELLPIVSSQGKLIDVLIQNVGREYNSSPTLVVKGSGSGARITPVVSNGRITEVKINTSGTGYTQKDTTIQVVPAGRGGKVDVEIRKWTIDRIEKLVRNNNISEDDGIVESSDYDNDNLKYTHGYAPRELRKKVLGRKFIKGKISFREDLPVDSVGTEVDTDHHSPIIGWAFDGNPIYGPYGYSSPSGGEVRLMKSGYEKVSKGNRPSISNFPSGFFIEDYEFKNSGDLDEHNGRFSITPEYPDGIYHYHATISETNDSSGPFENFRKPLFPYLIGNTFKSEVDTFNFSTDANQDDFNFNESGLLRNRNPYNFNSQTSSYNFLDDPKNRKIPSAKISSVHKGSIDTIEIVEKGDNYKNGDVMLFNPPETGGFAPKVSISEISGKKINSISVASTEVDNLEFTTLNDNTFVAVSTTPHNISGSEIVTISGLSTTLTKFDRTVRVGVQSSILKVVGSIGNTSVTGVVTTFSVTGNLNFPRLQENDILQISAERVKVININKQESSIRVLREYDGTVGAAYTDNEVLFQIPRRFTFTSNKIEDIDYPINKEYYFDPKITVGLGETFGVGISSNLFLGITTDRAPVSIGTGSTTTFTFQNTDDYAKFSVGSKFVSISTSVTSTAGVGSTGFDGTHEIVSIASTTISVKLDSSNFQGVGVTVFLDRVDVKKIPFRGIFIEDSEIKTGDILVYNSNGGDPVGVSTTIGGPQGNLNDGSVLFATVLQENVIGLSSVRVAISTTGIKDYAGIGTEGGLLFFTGIGTGVNHSLKTANSKVVTGLIVKNTATVSTSGTHGLALLDVVNMDVKLGISTTVVVKYNDANRRMIINPRDFSSSDVSITNNTIRIPDHKFVTGQKVIHSSASPSGGLLHDEIYYVVYEDKNRFKLSKTKYNSELLTPLVVDITSAQSGTISPINPPIDVTRNNQIIFDLRDPSLAYNVSFGSTSAFEFKLYKDENYQDEFLKNDGRLFLVNKVGEPGIGTISQISISVNNDYTNSLFYSLTPIDNSNSSKIPEFKKGIVLTDPEVIEGNKLRFVDSSLTGQKVITGIGTTVFKYTVTKKPEILELTKNNSTSEYKTNSKTAFGGISRLLLKSRGSSLISLPKFLGALTDNGSGALLRAKSSSIGKINKVKTTDIGFNYSADKTLSPEGSIPTNLEIERFAILKRIGITSAGLNYTQAPELILIDGSTNKPDPDVDLTYELGDGDVTINKNTKGLVEVPPRIIPIHNSNAIGFSSLTYDDGTKDVTFISKIGYSNLENWPFAVGDKVLVEGVSIGIGSTGTGFNSNNYQYNLFEIKSMDPNIGGSNGSIVVNYESVLNGNYPGNIDSLNSSIRITAEKTFPIFDIQIDFNAFLDKEKITTNTGKSGIVQRFDRKNEQLILETDDTFVAGDVIIGSVSGSQATILREDSPESQFSVDSSALVDKGFQRNTGFLNDELQRVSDNDYYQNLSYSIKSEVPLSKWEDTVDSIAHPAGFKRFSDLVIESKSETNVGFDTAQLGEVDSKLDLISDTNTNCHFDFDLVSENNLIIDADIASDEVFFNGKLIKDYSESRSNRALTIDDVSTEFNSEPRPTRFESANQFTLSDARVRKYISYIRDKRFKDERQISIVTLLHDDSVGYLNQYGRVDSAGILGSFDFSASGATGSLDFFPIKFTRNDYSINLLSFDLKGTATGVGTTAFGDSVVAITSSITLPVGTASTVGIVTIPTSHHNSRVLLEFSATDDSFFEFQELSVVYNGSDLDILEYGNLTAETLFPKAGAGLGTYGAEINGSNIEVKFTPTTGLTTDFVCNSMRVSFDHTKTGVGTADFQTAKVNSNVTSIGATTNPGLSTVASYDFDEFGAAYYIVSVKDTTNNRYQLSEVAIASTTGSVDISEYGVIFSDVGLGTVGAANTNSNVELYFYPEPSIACNVQVYQNAMRVVDEDITLREIPFENGRIKSDFGNYRGTERDIRRRFDLKHRGNTIFEKYFDGSSSTAVDVSENQFILPNHFFVTGEQITYRHSADSSPIGIETTTIPGVGSTDKLPPTLFVVKDADLKIRVSASASEALLSSPQVLDIKNLGIGTGHFFISTESREKCLLSIDNMIQSPIVRTGISYTTTAQIVRTDNEIDISGITSIFTGDLLNINQEYVIVESVGVGGDTRLLVQRGWMGSTIDRHPVNSTVTKYTGNYEIVDNTLNFIEAPRGPLPISTTSGRADERDWVGITTYSTFNGRAFLRSASSSGLNTTYHDNYVFDNIEEKFNGITTQFALKYEDEDVTGISGRNAIITVNSIVQQPARFGSVNILGDYKLTEVGSATTISFPGIGVSQPYDPNNSAIPIGGLIVSVGSSEGFAYQPLVSAGGTAIISGFGTVSSISIGNSGSGYRSGIQSVNVSVANSTTGFYNKVAIGTAVITDGLVTSVAITTTGPAGTSYTSTNAPIVFFDEPLSYSNLDLVYSSDSPQQGIGSGAKVNVVVSGGSSILSFELSSVGYGYQNGDILTIGVGGTVGVPTDISKTFREFQITVDSISGDEFSGWTFGELEVLDTLDSQINGIRDTFSLKKNDETIAIQKSVGSPIELASVLIVFVNDIIQIPGSGYKFNGGTRITFPEPLKKGDTTKIFFYRGTPGVDVVDVDILETVKEGDTIQIHDDTLLYSENQRTVTEVVSPSDVETNNYFGPGNVTDQDLLRPVDWCKQTEDVFINNVSIPKNRSVYEPKLFPTTNLIKNVSASDQEMYVESVRTFFDSDNENNIVNSVNKNGTIEILSQDSIVAASATAIVSAAGTVSSITIGVGGSGYTSAPEVFITEPVGLGSTQRATATSSITAGIVTTITVTTPGTGYTSTNAPSVLIESPVTKREKVNSATYTGDFGIICGVSSTSVGVASTGIVFDLHIPMNSFLRDTSIVGTAVTLSGISTEYYFVVSNSNIGSGITGITTSSGVTVGIATQFIDSIYEVASVSIAQTHVYISDPAVGTGLTSIARVVVGVSTYNNLSGFGTGYFGDYSWGRVDISSRTGTKEFEIYNNGLSGITTSPIVRRVNPLKSSQYLT